MQSRTASSLEDPLTGPTVDLEAAAVNEVERLKDPDVYERVQGRTWSTMLISGKALNGAATESPRLDEEGSTCNPE